VRGCTWGGGAAVLLIALLAGGATLAAERMPAGRTAGARFLMGTWLSIETEGSATESTFEATFDEVERLDSVLSNWKTHSEVSRLNGEAARASFRCSPDLFDAVDAALRWARLTEGSFDPTVEPLVEALGLREGRDALPGDVPGRAGATPAPMVPGGGAPQARLPIGWWRVHLDRRSRSVRFDTPGVGIDLGGIGKGIALDAAARVLRGRGVRRALLDFGGQVLALGKPGDSRGWEVGVADPDDRGIAVGALRAADISVATSGNSERSVASARGVTGHILDPARQRPAGFPGSVTVVAPDATTADALSTALFVMGPDRGTTWAEARGIPALYLWHDASGRLRRKSTRVFEDRFGGWAGTSTH
jgi:FAD:protein FMN transferase